jgi:hypothetical protein
MKGKEGLSHVLPAAALQSVACSIVWQFARTAATSKVGCFGVNVIVSG